MILLAGLGGLCASGCRSLPRSGFDPYGERLFDSCPLQGVLPSDCNLFGRRDQASNSSSIVPPPDPAIPAASVYSGSPSAPEHTLPGGLGAALPGSNGIPQYGSTATAMGSGVRGINTALIASPESEPTQVFADTGGYALPTVPVEGPAVIMTPREQIAPVGSEVVMISSYLGSRDRLITNEKIEWTVEGVGSIQKIDGGSCCDPLRLDFNRAKKVTESHAITKTSQLYQTLDRGTEETHDDIHLLRGQTWISVNSMREGTSHVTAYAPDMKNWAKRSDVGIIHWVDAQWVLPRLTIAPVGESRVLTTTLLRRTNGQPRFNWIIQYEILNGPAAGFGPDLAQKIEVSTNASGQASVVLMQREHVSGTNNIAIRIIRPAGTDGSDRRVTVGSETVRQAWSGSTNFPVRIQGPPEVGQGQDIPYEISVTNKASSPGQGILVLELPPSVTLVSSDLPAQKENDSYLWRMTVPAHGVATLRAVVRAVAPGEIWPKAVFYPQGLTPDTTPRPIPGTSIPTPEPAYPTPPPDNTTPGRGATVFHDNASTSPTLPSGTGPYSGVRAPQYNLDIQFYRLMQAPPDEPPIPEGACDIVLSVTNKGVNDIENIVLRTSLPEIYRPGGTAAALSILTNGKRDSKFTNISYSEAEVTKGRWEKIRLPAGGTLSLRTRFPMIPPEGYRMTGQILINGQVVGEKNEEFKPSRGARVY